MKLLVWSVLVVLLAMMGCQKPTESQPTAEPGFSQSLQGSFGDLSSGASRWVAGTEDSLDQTRNLALSLTLPPSPLTSEVYLLITNVANDAGTRTLGALASRSADTPPESGFEAYEPLVRAEPRLDLSSIHPTGVNLGPDQSRAGVRATAPVPADPALGTQDTFVDSLWTGSKPLPVNRHPMTLRVKQSDPEGGGRTVYIWVVDDCWVASNASTGTRFKVDQTMAQALADRFLKPNDAKDIYGLVTNIIGKEWADSGEPTKIDGTYYEPGLIDGGKQIHIVLADLNPVTKPADRRFGGGLMGYFHAWNNVRENNVRELGSNEKVLFAIDANSFANPDLDGVKNTNGTTDPWSWASYYPNDTLATLAHELQHMVQFYQKQVLFGSPDTDTWINEMASMAIEDLTADQMGFMGPRGLPSTDLSTGDVSRDLIWEGRLPLFNGTHQTTPLQYWPTASSTSSSLPSYSNSYAFGAWLTRNYGGPALWKSFVQGPGTNFEAVITAVNAHGGANQTYRSLVRAWGLATFLGGATSPAPLVYATSGTSGFSFPSVDGASYRTGSIDLYHYPMVNNAQGSYYGDSNGPYKGPLRWARSPAVTDVVGAGATWMGRVFVGSNSWSGTLNLPPYLVATAMVVVR